MMLNNADVAINLKLFKTLRFYHTFDPHEKTFFGWNVYRLMLTALAVLNECLFSFCLGCFVMYDKGWKNVFEGIFFVSVCSEHYQVVWQTCVFLYHKDVIWKIFDVARFNFLTSKACWNNICILRDKRAWYMGITNWFSIMTLTLFVQWTMFPLFNYWFAVSSKDDNDQRAETIFNLSFPVDDNTYNKYYFVYYFYELVLLTFFTYSSIVFDIFLISTCLVISCQYEVLTCAFESIGGYEDTVHQRCDEEYEHFKSILSDKIRLDDMVKSYYSFMKSIVLIRVALISSTIISLAYLVIVISSSAESVSVTNFLKFLSTLIYAILQLFMYCYLFNNINTTMASVNFGIYSCNWTMLDLKFQKLVLLAMRMNDSTLLIIKASPKKIIDLQLFGNVMTTSYNVVSVMVKTLKNN